MQAIYGFEREKLVCSQAYCHFKYPHKFLEELALQDAVSVDHDHDDDHEHDHDTDDNDDHDGQLPLQVLSQVSRGTHML